jgi:patatin-related protein
MYGGVSLAIYNNGVAQELLNMARATATVPREGTKDQPEKEWDPLIKDNLPGAMGVYRKLGQYLGIQNKEERATLLRSKEVSKADPIRTHLIVDVISGTSAGGINGVFLAKALARDQNMQGLKNLWLSEGDLGKLLNDKHSLKGARGFGLKQPQQSLLNSQRMYYKLLDALDTMGKSSATKSEAEPSPLVGELDLFITTTDIDGVPLPIDLFDDVVYERRYKNVFHFRYSTEATTGKDRDDFVKANDPFLAFAARCTSSFPFAFEAMRLCDITEIAKAFPPYVDKSAATNDWDKFFSDYMRNSLFDLDLEARDIKATGTLPGTGTEDQKLADAESELRRAFRQRSFGDGGYLDNKPFSYATSMLTRRFADCAVDRKLLYVEPTPEHPELTSRRTDVPDFAENVRAAALDLPRQETIREDIDRVYDRNVLLERVITLGKEVDADLRAHHTTSLTGEQFQQKDLDQTIQHYGVAYGAYHRLRVAEITTLLAELIARAAGHDPSSDATIAIRELVSAWRRSSYRARLNAGASNQPTENQFLYDFDIRYELRRQAFLNRRINLIIELDKDAESFLEAVSKTGYWPGTVRVADIKNGERENFQRELNRLKKDEIAPILKGARSAEETLLDRNLEIGQDLCAAIGKLKIGWPELKSILECNAGIERDDKADAILNESDRESVLGDLAGIIRRGFQIKKTSDSTRPTAASDGTLAARACIDHYRANYILYDLITYPVQYGSGAGEASIVDVFRISPEDAGTLMKESTDKSKGEKLAGRTLMSFGAFLDERWRRNDMLWGHLDGAERIISALLPDKKDRKLRIELIQEAHRGIITQEIVEEKNRDAVCGVLSNALANRATQEDNGANVVKFVTEIRDQYRQEWSAEQITDLTTGRPLDRHLPAEQALQYISRSTNITGNMFTGLAESYRLVPAKRFASWMAFSGTALGNLVAVAVPDRLPSLFFRHWLRLLYFFAIALILIGLVVPAVKLTGWEVLGIVMGLHALVAGLRAFIKGKLSGDSVRAAAKAAIAFVPAALVALGIVRVVEQVQQKSWTLWIELGTAGFVALVVSAFVFVRSRSTQKSVTSGPKKIPAQTPPSANQS